MSGKKQKITPKTAAGDIISQSETNESDVAVEREKGEYSAIKAYYDNQAARLDEAKRIAARDDEWNKRLREEAEELARKDIQLAKKMAEERLESYKKETEHLIKAAQKELQSECIKTESSRDMWKRKFEELKTDMEAEITSRVGKIRAECEAKDLKRETDMELERMRLHNEHEQRMATVDLHRQKLQDEQIAAIAKAKADCESRISTASKNFLVEKTALKQEYEKKHTLLICDLSNAQEKLKEANLRFRKKLIEAMDKD